MLPRFREISGCSPWSKCVMSGSVVSEHPRLTNREIIFEDHYTSVLRTDWQTDRRTTCRGNIALCVASRGKNDWPKFTFFMADGRHMNNIVFTIPRQRIVRFSRNCVWDVESSLSSSWREAFSRSLPPLRSFARTVGPPLATGPRSLLHPCRGKSGGSRWSTVGHRRVSTPVKAGHHPSTWCRFVGSGLLVHRVEVWRRAHRDPVFACERCTIRRTGRYDAGLHR